MEFLFEFFAEFVVQALFEIPAALLDGTLDLSERTTKAILKVVLYVLLGVGCGYVSYLIVPHTLTGHPPTPLASLLLIPLTVSGAWASAAQLLETRWNWELGISRFSYSFVLAMTFAGTRFALLMQ